MVYKTYYVYYSISNEFYLAKLMNFFLIFTIFNKVINIKCKSKADVTLFYK